jgi:hypothetical protein
MIRAFLARLKTLFHSKAPDIGLKKAGLNRLIFRHNNVGWPNLSVKIPPNASSQYEYGDLRIPITVISASEPQDLYSIVSVIMLMALTMKDVEFIERLKTMMEQKDLSIEIRDNGLKYLVLRKNYGSKIESCFGMTRQGIRWRFHRLFNKIYIDSYLAIFWIESNFGTQLRQDAITIAKEQVELRRKARNQNRNVIPPNRRQG